MNINVFTPEGLLWMAVFLVVSAALIFGGTCFGLLSFNTACSVDGAKTLVMPLLFAVAINQGVHAGTKPS